MTGPRSAPPAIAEGPLPEALSLNTLYFDLPGLRVHAAAAGPEDGRLVLLLHGFPEFWYSWRHQIGWLARAGFRVVAPDQRGYNLTGKAPPYDVDTLAGDVASLIEACGRDRALVAGHDWGAVVAWVLAEQHPSRVEALALLNGPHPTAMARALAGGNLRQLLRSWYLFFFRLPRVPERWLAGSDYRALRRVLAATSRPGTFSPVDLDRYRDAWSRPGVLPAMLGWYRAVRSSGLFPRSQPDPPRLRVPGLILWGERDVALGVELAEQGLARLENGRLVRFPDATHWVHEDLPTEVNRHILQFFADPRHG